MAYRADDEGIIFHTGSSKDVFKQVRDNQNRYRDSQVTKAPAYFRTAKALASMGGSGAQTPASSLTSVADLKAAEAVKAREFNDKRNALHSMQVDRLAAKVAEVQAADPAVICHVLGDLNTPDRDRLAPLTALGIQWGSVTPDLHGHQLTYVGSTLPGSRDMIRGLNTDHNAVTAQLKHKGAPVPTPTPGRYDRIQSHGVTMDNDTLQRLLIAERRLGYELTVVKGIQQATPGDPSGGTHDGPALDLPPFDWKRKVRVLRDLGFAIWHRPAIPGL